MKKIAILLLTGVVLSTAAMAQEKQKDIKTDEKVLKGNVIIKKEDKHEVGKDMEHLQVASAVKERKEVRHRRRIIHRQGKHLEAVGVEHPIEKAKHEAKADKEIKESRQ
jgi:hypothetical protein